MKDNDTTSTERPMAEAEEVYQNFLAEERRRDTEDFGPPEAATPEKQFELDNKSGMTEAQAQEAQDRTFAADEQKVAEAEEAAEAEQAILDMEAAVDYSLQVFEERQQKADVEKAIEAEGLTVDPYAEDNARNQWDPKDAAALDQRDIDNYVNSLPVHEQRAIQNKDKMAAFKQGYERVLDETDREVLDTPGQVKQKTTDLRDNIETVVDDVPGVPEAMEARYIAEEIAAENATARARIAKPTAEQQAQVEATQDAATAFTLSNGEEDNLADGAAISAKAAETLAARQAATKPIVFKDIDDEEEIKRHRIAEQANQEAQLTVKKQKTVSGEEEAEPENDAEAQRLASLEEAAQIEASRSSQSDQDADAEYMLNDSDANSVDAADIQAAADERETKRRNSLAKGVVDRYTVDGKNYLIPGADKQLAFTDNGKQIKVKLDDEKTVRDVVDLQASRGAQSIKVAGSAVLRRNAWVAAQKHGMAVTGYNPTAQDIAVYQKQAPENTITDTTEQVQRQKEARQAPELAAAPSRAPAARAAAPKRAELSGKLVEHGAARYNDDPTNNMSYYVVLDFNGNEKKQWGVQLREAVAKSGVQVGDSMSLRKIDVTDVIVKDKQGKEVEGRKAEWVIDAPERRELIKADALRAAAKAVSTNFSEPADRESMTRRMDERIANHQGELPGVKIHKQVNRAVSVPVQREEEKEQQTQ